MTNTASTRMSLSPKTWLAIVLAIIVGLAIFFIGKGIYDGIQVRAAKAEATRIAAEQARQVQKAESLTQMKAEQQEQLDILVSLKARLEYIQNAYAASDKIAWCKENPMPFWLKPTKNPTPQECETAIYRMIDYNVLEDIIRAYNEEGSSVPAELLEAEGLPREYVFHYSVYDVHPAP